MSQKNKKNIEYRRNCYRNLSEEEKEKKREYGRKQYKSPEEEQKKKRETMIKIIVQN